MLKTLLINGGRLLMLGIWGILILNFFHPFPSPLKYFMHVALFFMFFMHALQMLMLKVTLPKDRPGMSKLQEVKILLFGVFELLAWQQKQS